MASLPPTYLAPMCFDVHHMSCSRLVDCLQLDGARDLEITWSLTVAELVGHCVSIHAHRVFLIQSVSLIHLVCRCVSLSTTFALSHLIYLVSCVQQEFFII